MRSGRMQMFMDKTAITLSTACAIHCLFLPVFVVMLPALGTSFFANESFHHFLLWFVVPTSVLALTQGCRRHNDRIVLTFIVLGLALLITPTILAHDVLSEDGERLTTVLGAMALAFGHIRNYRLCRKKKCKV